MNDIQLKKLGLLTENLEVYLEDSHLLDKYMKDYENKDWEVNDGEGSEHVVYFSDDGNYVIKYAKDKSGDLGQERFERFSKELVLPVTPFISRSVGISPYFSVEKKHGMDLGDKFKKSPVPSLSSRLKICRDLFHGLSMIHQAGLIHLDIKPGNIFIDEEFNISIGDFGYLSEKDSNKSSGDIAYSPPLRSKRKGINIDIYAAALTCIDVMRWEREDTYCFEDLKMAIFRSFTTRGLCSGLSKLFSTECLRDFKNLDNAIPGIVDSLRCAIVGSECDSSCDSTASSIYEVWSEMHEKVDNQNIKEPEKLPPANAKKWWNT